MEEIEQEIFRSHEPTDGILIVKTGEESRNKEDRVRWKEQEEEMDLHVPFCGEKVIRSISGFSDHAYMVQAGTWST